MCPTYVHPNNKPDKLYRLIDSLHKMEKGFFKKFASLHTGEDANSLRLFDIYNNLKEYDKKKIDKQVSKEKFAPYLPKTKNYLYDLILRSLRAYNNEKDEWTKVRMMLFDASLLIKKSLHDDASTLIKKVKTIAYEREWYTLLTDAVVLEAKMIQTFDNALEEYYDKIKLANEEISKIKQTDRAAEYYHNQMGTFFKIAGQITKENIELVIAKAKEIVFSEKFIEYKKHSGGRLDISRSTCLYAYHFIISDGKSFYQEALRAFELIQQSALRQSMPPKYIMGHYYNLASAALGMNNFKIYELCSKEMKAYARDLNISEGDIYIYASNIIYRLQCEYYFKNIDHKNGLTIIAESKKEELNVDDTIDGNKASFYFYESAFLFFAGRYTECIKVLNTMELYSEKQSVIHHEDSILKILCHMALNNSESAVYLSKNHLNYLNKNYPNMSQRILFLNLILKENLSIKEIAKTFVRTIESENIPSDRTCEIGIIDLELWAKSTLQALPLNEIHTKASRLNELQMN